MDPSETHWGSAVLQCCRVCTICVQQCANVNPAFDIPDGVQKAAEHVVREVIKEVHGPFFNSKVSHRSLRCDTAHPCSQQVGSAVL